MNKKPVLALLLVFIAALGVIAFAEDDHVHNWSDYSVIKEPTCTSEGQEVRVCTICGATEVETLAMSDHEFGSWTFYSDEQHVRVCEVCGETERVSHDAAVSKTVSQAAANRLGKKNITCAACGYNYTRLVSAYDKLYSMEGSDVLGNDTSYIKVNTISFSTGNSKQLTLYSEGVFDLYAASNVTVELYANASSGEYRGLKLTSGKAVLTVSGANADLEFIQLAQGTSLSIEFKDGADSLAISSSEADLIYISLVPLNDASTLVTITRSALEGSTLSTAMRAYTANTVKIEYENGNPSLAGGTLLYSASWSYNASARSLAASAESGRLTVKSGESLLLNGASSGVLSAGDVPWGWHGEYAASDGAFTYYTPTYTLEGYLSDMPVKPMVKGEAVHNGAADDNAPDNGGDAQSGGNSDAPVPRQVEYLNSTTVMSQTLGASPVVDIRFENGTYSVRVSVLPSGYTLDRIQFVQKFDAGSMSIINAFTADASFEVINSNGSIIVTVILKDSKGTEYKCDAGAFEYRAY